MIVSLFNKKYFNSFQFKMNILLFFIKNKFLIKA